MPSSVCPALMMKITDLMVVYYENNYLA